MGKFNTTYLTISLFKMKSVTNEYNFFDDTQYTALNKIVEE